MAPAIPSVKRRLSYPLYAIDFDPQDANRLIVGGGGGGGAVRSGVGNKISVLDVSRQDSLQVVSELELSRDEDSVNTLAVGPRRRNSVLLYAGINSAEADLAKGKNEHFRVFAADVPSKSKPEPKIAELSRSALFSTTDTETYQRLLRVSGQIGAVATGRTGRATDAQIAIFDMAQAGNSTATPKLRARVELPKEAMDMDMFQLSDDEHQLVHCDGYEIYILNIGKTSISGPHCVFTMPHDESSGAKARPSFRCIRSLTPTFVLAVANLPRAGGAVLQGFRLPKLSDLGKEENEGKARLSLSARLPKTVGAATGMAVRNLSPPATPSTRQGDTQFVVAVMGNDSSITLYTLEHQTMGDIYRIGNLRTVATLKDVHRGPISGIAFSPFSPPSKASSNSPSAPSQTQRPAHLKLASIGSMANTCVVHTLPLKRLAAPKQANATRGPPRPPRYVLALKSRGPSRTDFLVFVAVVIALLAAVLQGALEVKGLARPVIGARRVTPASWHRPGLYYQQPESGWSASLTSSSPSPVPGGEDIFAQYRDLASKQGEKLVLHHAGDDGDEAEGAEEGGRVRVEGHDAQRHGEARRWEELHPAQREAWKERLRRTGHWAEDMGETVFKGVLFSEIAGVVGQVVA